jgi:hypothetical protein
MSTLDRAAMAAGMVDGKQLGNKTHGFTQMVEYQKVALCAFLLFFSIEALCFL